MTLCVWTSSDWLSMVTHHRSSLSFRLLQMCLVILFWQKRQIEEEACGGLTAAKA